MATLTVTTRGQVTFRKDVLQHLGIEPGGKIEIDLLPNGRAELRAEPRKKTFRDLQGILEGETDGARLTIEEIQEAIADNWARAGVGEE